MMRLELHCPACDSENTQRLSLVHLLRGDTGLGARLFPSPRLTPPYKPPAVMLGLLAGLIVGTAIFQVLPWELVAWSLLPVVLTWVSVTIWLHLSYKQRLMVWEDRVDKHFFCWRCGRSSIRTSRSPRSPL